MLLTDCLTSLSLVSSCLINKKFRSDLFINRDVSGTDKKGGESIIT